MGKRGPKPTPKKVLAFRGSARAVGRKGEPIPRAGRPECPAWLGEVGRAEWKRVCSELDAMGVLFAADMAAIALRCETWEAIVECQAKIAKEGRFIILPNKLECPNPAVKVLQTEKKILSQLDARLGLDPASRARLTAPEAQQDTTDKRERFFKGG